MESIKEGETKKWFGLQNGILRFLNNRLKSKYLHGKKVLYIKILF